MDTRLKNSKTRSGIYAAVFITEVIAACALTVATTIFSALGTMSWAKDISPDDWHFYTGNIIDQSKYDQLQNNIGIWGMLAILLVAGLLILLAFMTGKGKLNDDGSVHLTWFDKMWSELQIIVASLAGVWAGSITVVLYEIWLRGDYLGVWESTGGEDSYFSGPLTKEIGMTYCMVGLVVSISMFLLCFLSLLKKIKTKQFWEKSLLGGAFLAIYRSIKGSDKTLLKVIIILMAGAILSATWILLPVMLVLILIFVPKQVKKFTAIKEGIEEVKSGNLSYKIPVEEDAKGIKGEFDRMAEGINDISQASNIAVQNELKNQRMKTELISNVSHDLKTPLTSMISYIDLMKQEGLDSPNAPEYLDIIDNKTQRLKDLTENLFEAAKASSGAIPVNMESIDLSSLMTQSLAEMEERLSARGLQIQVKNECDDTHIMADGQLMWRVLENLLGNVSKYAMDNSRVYIDIRETEPKNAEAKKMVIFEVKNISGAPLNISADELMERFKRGDESRNTEGSGLGLAIAKDLVKLMNGVFEITVDGDLFKATVMMEKA